MSDQDSFIQNDLNGFIEYDFKLPTHANELSNAEDHLKKLRIRFLKVKNKKLINGKIHTEIFEEIIRVLDYLGGLSKPAFRIETELEEMYFRQYRNSPALAKKLWLDHYTLIHRPYTKLKNRAFRMLDELDEEYHKQFGAENHPPNWNI
jgi:hypothetical protein